MKPTLAITMGDAAGIGPEIILKSLSLEDLYGKCNPVILGDYKVMNGALDIIGSNLIINRVAKLSDCKFTYGTVDLLDFDNVDTKNFRFGIENPKFGKAAVEYTIEAAIMCMDKKIDAMVSAPLNKESMHMAGYKYEGQTQILAEQTKTSKYAMILIYKNIRLMMLTGHMSLIEAISRVKEDRIYDLIKLAFSSLKNLGFVDPIIAVAGINPHASENGLFGTEEADEIAPAIERAKKENINIIGPVPPDSVFVKAKEGAYDLVLTMYHDQANIPLKVLGFGKIVTFIAGLPIIRTSVGHGTAFDIAGKNLAVEENLVEAIKTASELAVLKNKNITK